MYIYIYIIIYIHTCKHTYMLAHIPASMLACMHAHVHLRYVIGSHPKKHCRTSYNVTTALCGVLRGLEDEMTMKVLALCAVLNRRRHGVLLNSESQALFQNRVVKTKGLRIEQGTPNPQGQADSQQKACATYRCKVKSQLTSTFFHPGLPARLRLGWQKGRL